MNRRRYFIRSRSDAEFPCFASEQDLPPVLAMQSPSVHIAAWRYCHQDRRDRRRDQPGPRRALKDRDLLLCVGDKADRPADAKTVKASAKVLSGEDKAAVHLTASGAEMLTGQAPFSVRKDGKIIFTFSVGIAKSELARFSLGKKQDHKGHKH